ncbi:hypothetical protein PHLCEN_2v2698 [Hermanssonia centrifuga]|uniref:Uncharacterized protein n=1 Tax=Hermanssonia centrifuga TaxID=98765 RepID=A0A2R6RIF0_9APHY|nr:hypothetical protein PHLCEN_2v2698 [Hermanssonia centrifuga]
MCLLWRARQQKLGVDDFGNPVSLGTVDVDPQMEDSPIPVTQGPEGGVRVEEAISAAVETDMHVGHEAGTVDEETPLLKKDAAERQVGWFGRLLPKRR